MKCFNPLEGYQPHSGGQLVFNPPPGSIAFGYKRLTVPCGSCIGCRLNQSRVWAARMCMEAQLHDQNSFITLTYSPENLPFAGQLEKDHVQLFLKRLRKSLDKKYAKKIRYYYVGEYGDLNGRPHYHVLLFGHDFSADRKYLKRTKKGFLIYTSPTLSDCWPYGHANIGEFNFESAAYCARYCLKKQTGKKNPIKEEVYCDIHTGEVVFRTPEFGQPSTRPGIAANWYARFGMDVRRTDYIVMRNNKMLPPRYFDKLTQKHYFEDYEKIKDNRTCNVPDFDSSYDTALGLRQAGRARELLQTASHLKGTL